MHLRACIRGIAGLALLGVLALSPGCYWSDEDKRRFDERTREFAEQIKGLKEAGEQAAHTLRESNPAASNALLKKCAEGVVELEARKATAYAAFQECNSNLLEALVKAAIKLLDELVKLLPSASKLLSFLELLGDQYNIDVRGRATLGLGQEPNEVRFEITSGAGVEIRDADGTVPWRLSASGSLTITREKSIEGARIALKSLSLLLDPRLLNGGLFSVASSEVPADLLTTRDDALFAGGWRSTYSGDVTLSYLSGSNDPDPARKSETVTLDLFFDESFTRCALSTLGFQPAGSLFPIPRKAPDSRIWGFHPVSRFIVGRESVFLLEGGIPLGECEVYASLGWGAETTDFEGAIWKLDRGNQELVGRAELNANGNGIVRFTPAAVDAGGIRFYQGLVRGGDASKSTVVCIARISRAFLRGDTNGDGRVDIADPVGGFRYLFAGGAPPGCEQAADSNASDSLDISDSIFTLSWLFGGGREPLPPGPFECGVVDDPLDVEALLSCAAHEGCSGSR